MLRVIIEMTITQQPTADFPDRKKQIGLSFVSEYEVESSWANQTDNAEFTLPKDIYARDENGKRYQLAGTNKHLGGNYDKNNPPLFLKGDVVVFNAGYIYQDDDDKDVLKMSGRNGLPDMFTGWISEVSSNKPFVLKCQDNMWKLKQIPVKKKVWTGYSLQKMFTEILAGTEFVVSKKSDITRDYDMGGFETFQNDTAALVLARLRREMNFISYFRGNELRIGFPIYVEEEARTLDFAFGENIISSDLIYKRKDDVILSAVVKTKVPKVKAKKTKDGEEVSQTEDFEILIYPKSDGAYTYTKEKPFPENLEGERRTLEYLNVSEKEMFELGKADLQKYHYSGFRGSFLTFGLPFVKHGDNIRLTNKVLPDQNGTYKVKAVRYYGNVNEPVRQEITLDYKFLI